MEYEQGHKDTTAATRGPVMARRGAKRSGFMSNADYDVAYCDACKRCHLNGICPKDRALANDANREMGLPDDEDWGDK